MRRARTAAAPDLKPCPEMHHLAGGWLRDGALIRWVACAVGHSVRRDPLGRAPRGNAVSKVGPCLSWTKHPALRARRRGFFS
jgi:hypothetical protein